MLNPKDNKKANFYIYWQFIRKLIYLVYDTYPDIVFVIRQLNKLNANSSKKYLQAAKRIIRYLKSIIKIDLIFGQKIANCYLRKLLSYSLIRYADSNFTKDLKNQKSVMC